MTRARRRERLGGIALELAEELEPAEIGAIMVGAGRRALEADAALVYRADPAGRLELLASHGHEAPAGDGRGVAPDAPAPVRDAVRAARLVVLESREEMAERYPEGGGAGHRAIVACPLTVGGRALGGLLLAFRAARRISEDERRVVTAMASHCALALERSRLAGARRVVAGRDAFLSEVSVGLDAPIGMEERLRRLAALVVPRLAELATVRLADGATGRSRLVAAAHVDPEQEAVAWRLYSRCTPAVAVAGPQRVIATGRPELVTRIDDALRAAWAPDEEALDDLRRLASRSYLCVPLAARGRILGALALQTASAERPLGPDELDLAEEIGRRAGLAVDMARLYEEERAARGRTERARARVERLQRVTAALSSALTRAEVARVIVSEGMEALGARAGALVLSEAGEVSVMAAVGYPSDLLRAGMRFPPTRAYPLMDVLRGGEALFLETEWDWSSRYGPPRSELGAAGIVLPLVVGDRVVGAITFRFGRHERVFSEGERRLTLILAQQAAGALERARLYESERDAARVLQRRLLPERLPRPRIATLGVRYAAAAAGRVGGDFYDAVELPDGRVSLIVGDVVGHGLEAAATMGQLRSGWRALALEGSGPGDLLEALSRFAEGVPGAAVATAACAELAPGGRLRYACAGHPEPLLRTAGGAAAFLEGGRGGPLAVPLHPYREDRAALGEGDVLLLYTDGLVERRGQDTEPALERLARTVAEHPAVDLEALLDHVMDAGAGDSEDDCALLACRYRAGARALSRYPKGSHSRGASVARSLASTPRSETA